ncbi:BCAM0308 family protein [Candidatus Nitrospira bockiana]
MSVQADDPVGVSGRRDRTIQEHEHDSYKLRGKLEEPSVCSQCGAVFHRGRWTWGPAPAEAHQVVCPACHRIRDHYPQGVLTLSGPFLAEHKEEVVGLARNEEAREKAEHPLARIMSIREERETLILETTDVHLPRRIGEALHHAYRGDFSFHYDEGERFVRARWQR